MLKGGLIFCCWANGADNKFKRGEYYPIDEVAELDPILDYSRDHWVINDLHPDPVYGVMIGGIVAILKYLRRDHYDGNDDRFYRPGSVVRRVAFYRPGLALFRFFR